MNAIEEVINRVNWEELREQKLELVRCGIETEWVEGLLSLIDHIQDAAVADGVATAVEVFGETYELE
jgi:hypothetical protein